MCTCNNSAQRAGVKNSGLGAYYLLQPGQHSQTPLSGNLRAVVCSYEWGEAIRRKYLHEEPDRPTTTTLSWKGPEICKVCKPIVMKTYRKTTALAYSLLYYKTGCLCFLAFCWELFYLSKQLARLNIHTPQTKKLENSRKNSPIVWLLGSILYKFPTSGLVL